MNIFLKSQWPRQPNKKDRKSNKAKEIISKEIMRIRAKIADKEKSQIIEKITKPKVGPLER